VLRPTLPTWVRAVGAVWVVWICACLPLAALPYGGGRERTFDLLQQSVANLGPALGVLLVVGLAGREVLRASRTTAAPFPRIRTGY